METSSLVPTVRLSVQFLAIFGSPFFVIPTSLLNSHLQVSILVSKQDIIILGGPLLEFGLCLRYLCIVGPTCARENTSLHEFRSRCMSYTIVES